MTEVKCKTKTTTIKDGNEAQQRKKKKLGEQKSKYSEAKKRRTKIESIARLLVYNRIQTTLEIFMLVPRNISSKGC